MRLGIRRRGAGMIGRLIVIARPIRWLTIMIIGRRAGVWLSDGRVVVRRRVIGGTGLRRLSGAELPG